MVVYIMASISKKRPNEDLSDPFKYQPLLKIRRKHNNSSNNNNNSIEFSPKMTSTQKEERRTTAATTTTLGGKNHIFSQCDSVGVSQSPTQKRKKLFNSGAESPLCDGISSAVDEDEERKRRKMMKKAK